jgi:RNA polymerase sigma factor (sigma-70 family)
MKSSEFKQTVLPHSTRLYKLAFRLLGNREEAEDAIQEVFMKLWKMRKDLASYQSIEALAVRITRNHCLDQLRKRKTSRSIEDDRPAETRAEEKDPSEVLESSERVNVLNSMINSLGEPQRSLVYFRHIEGKEYEEISALTNMTENAIRVSISRARKQLKEMLQKQYASWTI